MYVIILFLIGLFLGSIFVKLGLRLPINISLKRKSMCLNCERELTWKEKIPIISYIIQKGKCNYCHEKISRLYIFFELLTGILYSVVYLVFKDSYFPLEYTIFGLLVISSLIIIMVSDIKYMIIPNEVLIISSILIIIMKLYLGFLNDEIFSLLDMGYSLIFMFKDALIMFLMMLIIKKIGDLVFKKASLGGGDIKLMAFIAIFMGYKLSIVVIFLASFFALPLSIINIHKKNEQMLPFGPYLAIATILLFLTNVDFNSLIDFIK